MNFNQDTIQLEDQISHSNQESLADDNYKDINNNKGYPQRQNIYSIRSNQTSSTKECTSYQNKISQREGSQTSSDQRIKDQKKTEEEQLHNLLKKCYEEWQEEEQQIQQKILLNQESNDKNLIEQGSQAHTFLQILVQLPEMKNILKNEGKIMNLTKKKIIIQDYSFDYKNPKDKIISLEEQYQEVKKICKMCHIKLIVKNYFRVTEYLEKRGFIRLEAEIVVSKQHLRIDLIAYNDKKQEVLLVDWKYTEKTVEDILKNQYLNNQDKNNQNQNFFIIYYTHLLLKISLKTLQDINQS